MQVGVSRVFTLFPLCCTVAPLGTSQRCSAFYSASLLSDSARQKTEDPTPLVIVC